MQELKLETRIVGMLEYLELIGMTAQEAMEDFGVLAQEYAYTTAYVAGRFWERCFAPVVRRNYEEAVQYNTRMLLEHYAEDLKNR